MQTDASPRAMTAAEFEHYAALPENADRRLELIAGEASERAPDYAASVTGTCFLAQIVQFVRAHQLGRVTGANGGYRVGADYLIPNGAFLSTGRQPAERNVLWCPVAPDLAVEVLSPGNTEPEMRLKVVSYLRAGTAVWVVNPDRRLVECYAPDQPPRLATANDTLTTDVLPGFALAVKDVFPE